MIDFQKWPFRGTKVCELGAIPDFLPALPRSLETLDHLEIDALDTNPACIETAHPDPSHTQTLNPEP